jgi:hypothetical protein
MQRLKGSLHEELDADMYGLGGQVGGRDKQ